MRSAYQIVHASRTIPILAGGVALAGGVTRPNTVYTDPYLEPPENATSINLDVNQAVTGANTAYTPAGLALSIPRNCYGVISSINLLLDGIVLASNVRWQLRVNNAPVPGFNNLTILGRSGAASVSKSYDGPLRIVIPLGGSISVRIVDVDGGAYTVGTSLYGWFWPQQR